MSASGQKRTFSKSFDHIVRQREQLARHLDTERSRRLHIDDKFEFVRLEHRKLGGLGSLKDATGIDAELAKHADNVGSVAHQAAGGHKISNAVNRRNLVARRQCGKLYPARSEECVRSDEERIGTLPRKRSKGGIDLADRRCVDHLDL